MKRPLRTKPPLLLCMALLLSAVPARAEEQADARAQASSFFDAGAQAYDAGQYVVAAEAFLKAYDLIKSPSLLFSAAQAYRRQYLTEPSPDVLRRAVALYREYLRAEPKAKRREDAMGALEALAPLEARLSAQQADPGRREGDTGQLVEIPYSVAGGGAPATPASTPGRATRLLLTARPDSAQVSLDGGPFLSIPVVTNVSPGLHTVRVRAEGYHDEQITVRALPNDLMPSHVVLRPKPARLRVLGTSGARVTIDGQVRATVPTEAPLPIEPGAHAVTVSQRGHQPYSKVIDFSRDQSVELTVDLAPTTQRIAAWTALSVGAAGAIAGGVLAGFALAHQGDAVALRDKRDAGALSAPERDEYNRAAAARDDFAVAAAIAGGAAVLTLATGVGLFVLDDPEVLPPSGERPETPSSPEPRTDFTVGALSLGVRVSF